MIVTSPFVSVGPVHPGSSLQSLLTGDRIQLKGKAGFQLDGRADRIVKVGEKRLALPEMERALMAHPWVEDAALIVLQRCGNRPGPCGRRTHRRGRTVSRGKGAARDTTVA